MHRLYSDLGETSLSRRTTIISLWVKVAYTLFVCVLVPAYWIEYRPANFLWASNIALLVTLVALWTENRLLTSMMAIAVLVLDGGWTIDLVLRLVLRPSETPMLGTQYMFESEVPLWIRSLSFFHVVLPVLLVWLVNRLRYERRALFFQTLVAWIVLPITYVVTDPSANINYVFGLGPEPQTWMPGPLFLVALMVTVPLVFYLPAHLLLGRLCGDDHQWRL